MTFRKTCDGLVLVMRRAYDLAQERKYDEAVRLYRDVLAQARKLGVDSPFLLWSLAVALDQSGEYEMAFETIELALEQDPLAGPFLNSFDIIARHLREALADEDREVDDPSTPRLYELLVRANEADVCAHVAMVRFCAATGELERAAALADALTLLSPQERDAWLARAEVARARGDVALAERCLAEAACLGEEPVPFAIPGVARG